MSGTAPPTYLKDPSDVLDYKWLWGDWLSDGELIVDSVVGAPPGITINSQSNTTDTTTVWLAGGTAGEVYLIPNKITTSQGRTVERNLRIQVQDR